MALTDLEKDMEAARAIKQYYAQTQQSAIRVLSQVSENELKSLQECIAPHDGSESDDIIDLSRRVYQFMVDTWPTWSGLSVDSRPPKPTPVSLSEKVAMRFLYVVESAALAGSNATEPEESDDAAAAAATAAIETILRQFVQLWNRLKSIRFCVSVSSTEHYSAAASTRTTTVMIAVEIPSPLHHVCERIVTRGCLSCHW